MDKRDMAFSFECKIIFPQTFWQQRKLALQHAIYSKLIVKSSKSPKNIKPIP
jgi:hypothetical protein